MANLTTQEQNTTQPPLTPEILVPRLGDYLVEKGVISVENLKEALARQNAMRGNNQYPQLGQILIEMGVIDRLSLDQAITEQILQLREALQQYNQQLERRVKERTIELQQALQKLSELNQLKANFVANISHELRTPLTHIKGYLELLIDSTLGPLTEEQTQALKVMRQASSRLEKLIEDLILFSAAERGKIQLALAKFDVGILCKKVAKNRLENAQKKNIALHVKIAPTLPQIEADQEKIAWAVDQLLDNAIKFTPEGGKVTLTAHEENGAIIIAVSDTGIGMPNDKLKEIFEPFHQLDSSSTRKYGGTGLGLALVAKIVEAHNANIRVRSEVGKGSVFKLVLKAT
ncbi:MAG: hypothetical protein HPY45_01990 [Anaerolineae bacterium]|nr:hypothetical protein [Anaerolineae bacterium]